MSEAKELNLDGIIGPTHNYGGLSFGNLASMHHQSLISNPKEAALQGLAKMRFLHRLGIPQAVLPPHERPYLPVLYSLGYKGNAKEVLESAFKDSQQIVITCSSAASMWMANAATISPSSDTEDGFVHITPANLISKLHRSFESIQTSEVLRKVFNDPTHFVHHRSLPPSADFGDEGAANHIRLSKSHNKPGIEVFVFGRYSFASGNKQPKHFPARQTFEASQAVARLHRLDPSRTLLVQQNPDIIDEGVFHNDVISVGNEHVLFTHEKAFVDMDKVLEKLKDQISGLKIIIVKSEEVSVQECVKTYLFNSQLVTLPSNEMALIAPFECEKSPIVSSYLNNLIKNKNHPIKQLHYLNLRESMQNGGGPACLRLRAVLTDVEMSKISQGIIFTDELDKKLVKWVENRYRDRLHPKDLGDSLLLQESYDALDELTTLLGLGNIYSFQK